MDGFERIDGELLYDLWAPAESPWSAWAKPVLFAHMTSAEPARITPPALEAVDWSWLPGGNLDTALVLDLPGQETVYAAAAVAQRGYRPVPLFNTSPGPAAALDLAPVMRGLADCGAALVRAALPAEAPPAFMLDAERLPPGRPPGPGKFDNRWITFPQDFPSGVRLLAAGVRTVLVLRRSNKSVADDLRDVLLGWQKAGLLLQIKDISRDEAPTALSLPSFGPLRLLSFFTKWGLGLRRNSAGGFGATVPEPKSGGGHYG
ncbi:MAG: hypothetical protein IPM18_06225 [Phycisphaerales bacterium]|nr:hypothetical protein [Phycisphaerales bacterium]